MSLKMIAVKDIKVIGNVREVDTELAKNIKEVGIIQPLLVRKNGKGFELVSGGRRFDWRGYRLGSILWLHPARGR